MATARLVTRAYPDFPVSALHHVIGATVHAVRDANATDDATVITGRLTDVVSGTRPGVVYVAIITPADEATGLETVLTLRADGYVSVSEPIDVCDEHGIDAGVCNHRTAT